MKKQGIFLLGLLSISVLQGASTVVAQPAPQPAERLQQLNREINERLVKLLAGQLSQGTGSVTTKPKPTPAAPPSTPLLTSR